MLIGTILDLLPGLFSYSLLGQSSRLTTEDTPLPCLINFEVTFPILWRTIYPMLSTWELLFGIVVPTFYGYLGFLYYRGFRTKPPRKWWIVGGAVGVCVGVLSVVIPYMLFRGGGVLGAGLLVIAMSYSGLPWVPSLWWDNNDAEKFFLMAPLLAIIAPTLVFGTAIGQLRQPGGRNKAKAAFTILGAIACGLLSGLLLL